MILLDTCVVSELAKAAPDRHVLEWLETVPDDALHLSVLTLGEIRKGAHLLEPGPRRKQVETWLEGLRTAYAERVLGIDAEVALHWGSISAVARRMGRPRPPVDSLLAATAVRYGLTLATRNVGDFEGTGAAVVNPWEQAGG